MDIETLQSVCKGRSKRSLFRDLSSIGYLSSYSHAGKFYTLIDIPNFDEYGLWDYNKVFFSKYGTLKSTISTIVDNSIAGFSYKELKGLLQVRVQNTLNDLVKKNIISRKLIGEVFLYISANKKVSASQISKRHEQTDSLHRFQPTDPLTTIEILLELLRSDDWQSKKISERLQARGISVTAVQVERIFSRYNIKKKSSRD